MRKRGRNINVWLPLTRPPTTGDQAHNPGMCPDWGLNWQPFGSQASAQSTEPQQPGPFLIFWAISILLSTVAAPVCIPTNRLLLDICSIVILSERISLLYKISSALYPIVLYPVSYFIFPDRLYCHHIYNMHICECIYVCMYLLVLPYLQKQKPFRSLLYSPGPRRVPC